MENSLSHASAGYTAPVPQSAASIILMRENPNSQFSILLLRRSLKQSFMGGAFVFPGGRMDVGDADKSLAQFISGTSMEDLKARLQEPEVSLFVAMGLYMTALRETFEEAGVLLAYTSSGEMISFDDPETSRQFLKYRRYLYDHTLTLTELASNENLKYSLDMLFPYAHWITPELEKKRFDTRFFIARIPAGQEPAHDMMETTEARWITPAEALEEQKSGGILLMPPTLMIISKLNEFNATEEVLQYAKSIIIRPILPQIDLSMDTVKVLLPWDPGYRNKDYGEPHRDGEISRLILENGIWRTSM